MRNHLMLTSASLFSMVALNKHNEGAQGSQGAQVPASPVVDTLTVTIASVDVALPIKFKAGHVLTENEAKVLDAGYQRQYSNNKNAAFKAWEEKAAAWDKAKAEGKAEGVRPENPCTEAALLKDYADYVPKVGAAGQTSLEKLRDEAGLRRFKEMMDEHNEAVAAGGKSHFGSAPAKMPSGKGSAEEKAKIVAKILSSEKQALHVQRHIDAILAERKAEKDAPAEAKAVSVDSLDF